MNVYLCNAGMQEVIADTLDVGIPGCGINLYEQELAFEFIAAATRGKARRMITWKYDLDFIDSDVSIRKLLEVDGIPEGIINNSDLEDELGLWEIVERKNLLGSLAEDEAQS